MTRRALLAVLAGAALDPERLLWQPGKFISIPRPKRKGRIVRVGEIIDNPGGGVGIIGWWTEGGDSPGIDARDPDHWLIDGYTIDELRTIAKASGTYSRASG